MESYYMWSSLQWLRLNSTPRGLKRSPPTRRPEYSQASRLTPCAQNHNAAIHCLGDYWQSFKPLLADQCLRSNCSYQTPRQVLSSSELLSPTLLYNLDWTREMRPLRPTSRLGPHEEHETTQTNLPLLLLLRFLLLLFIIIHPILFLLLLLPQEGVGKQCSLHGFVSPLHSSREAALERGGSRKALLFARFRSPPPFQRGPAKARRASRKWVPRNR